MQNEGRPVALRNEVDLYGYSEWLARHLGYPIIPKSLRGFQHGWIWWNVDDVAPANGFGMDPNLDHYFGALVQDKALEASMRARGIYAHAAGLPFQSYYQHCGLKGSWAPQRQDEVLFVPAHSNPWLQISEDVLTCAAKASFLLKGCAILLSWNDRHLAPVLAPHFKRVEIGAGALEADSFLRMAHIFERYGYVISDAMGSHIYYARLCGAHVGIDAELYKQALEGKARTLGIDYQRSKLSPDFEMRQRILQLDYIDRRYPGLVVDSGLPTDWTLPVLASERPDRIAHLLGWDLTLESDLVKGR
jgi:hypothetical protein